MSKKLHIVIGNTNSKKSSLIRNLTGVGQTPRLWDVAFSVIGSQKVYILGSSLQESYKPISPMEFIDLVNSTECEHFLFPLWIKARGAYPCAAQYLNDFRAAGFDIHNLAILGACTATAGFSGSNATVNIAAPALQTTNEIAANVRSAWGWI